MISAKVIRKRMIKNYPKQFDLVSDKFLPDAGLLVEGAAKRQIRENRSIRSGRLRDSIISQVEGKQAIIGTNVFYAPYVEYGTHRSRAKPFLRPALDKNRRKLIALYKQIFKRYFGGK